MLCFASILSGIGRRYTSFVASCSTPGDILHSFPAHRHEDGGGGLDSSTSPLLSCVASFECDVFLSPSSSMCRLATALLLQNAGFHMYCPSLNQMLEPTYAIHGSTSSSAKTVVGKGWSSTLFFQISVCPWVMIGY